MINYHVLGVFTKLYGENAEMTLGRSLLISVVGFLLVIVVLLLLALVVKCFSAIFGKADKKSAQEQPAEVTPAAPVPAVPAVSNDPKLEGVSEEEAAVVMAVISHQTGIPLNRLKFNSIKLSEGK